MSTPHRPLISIFILGSLFLSLPALAGGMEGGGGKAVVCRDAKRAIRSAEPLDLYEGRVIYGLHYAPSTEDWQTQAARALEGPGGYPRKWLATVIQHLRVLPAGTQLVAVNDALETVMPTGCAIEQAAHYVNDEQILVDGEIWASLSQTGKAGLIVHEASYRYLREFGDTDSRRARKFTAYRMAGATPTIPTLRSGTSWSVSGPAMLAHSFSTLYWGARVRALRQLSPNWSLGGEGGLMAAKSGWAFCLLAPVQAVAIYEPTLDEGAVLRPYGGLSLGFVLAHGSARFFRNQDDSRMDFGSIYEFLAGAHLDREGHLFAELRLGEVYGEFTFTPSIGWRF